MSGVWAEPKYSLRRALADALAVLRATSPEEDAADCLNPIDSRRAVAAIGQFDGPLGSVSIDGSGRVDVALAVYLDWIGAHCDPVPVAPKLASVLAMKSAFEIPSQLHRAIVETICSAVVVPVQDL